MKSTKIATNSHLYTVLKQCAEINTRSLLLIQTEQEVTEQVMIIHHLITKLTEERPSILWCHQKDSEVPRQSRKQLKKLEKKIKSGQCDISKENAYELFLLSTSIKYCSFADSQQILGNTYGMCIIQDVEDLTPNVLCRVAETVHGGGAIVILLPGYSSLKDLFHLSMNVHSKLRTQVYDTIIPLFNQRLVISLGWCNTCVILNESLEITDELPPPHINSKIKSKILGKILQQKTELDKIKETISDAEKPLPQLISLCKTVDQAKAVLKMVDVVTEKVIKATVSLTAGRGRGKSAALGIAVAAAVHYGVTNIFVVSPCPQNLNTFFNFVFKGFDALEYEDSTDYEIIQSVNPEYHKAIIRVNVFRKYRQVIQYVDPSDTSKISQAELVVIDEAAAIPLPKVKALFGNHNLFLASTINGYEGTGRSLSLKLLQQLRQQSAPPVVTTTDDQLAPTRTLHEITLEQSIRYSDGDAVEEWLYKLLCLDASASSTITTMCPPPASCSLYYVNREVLFSGHKESEEFLHQITSLLVASHYRNSPDDLQILADAPAHKLFVLLPPVTPGVSTLPPVLCIIQACLEGDISRKKIEKTLRKGDRPCGDLIPWTLSAQFSQPEFAELTGLRIVRVATHPDYQSMGYGMRAMSLLNDYYCKKFITLEEVIPKLDINYEQDQNNESSFIIPPKCNTPLLSKLSEQNPEELDYLGVSYGITSSLFKFWKKCKFRPVYISQVQNKVTGEHSCIMLRHITGLVDEFEQPDWFVKQSQEFLRRYLGLLPSPLKDLPSSLAINIIQSHSVDTNKEISWNELKTVITGHDIQRLEKYTKNLADRYLITDLLPGIAYLFFSGRLPAVNLSTLQCSLLLGIGLQHHSMDKVSQDLDLPIASALGQFNRALKRLLGTLNEVQEHSISKHLPEAPKEFIPVSISLDQDLEDAAQDYEKQSKIKETIFGDISKYSIQGDSQDWDKAFASNTSDIISIKSKKRPAKMTDQELEKELNEPSKKKKLKKENNKGSNPKKFKNK